MDENDPWIDIVRGMKNRTHFGFGAYVLSGVHDRYFFRSRFVMEIAETAPETLDALRVLIPAYEAYAELAGTAMPRWSALEALPAEPIWMRDAAEFLLRGIRVWGATFHLADEWLLDTALMTLWAWWRCPERQPGLAWVYPPVGTDLAAFSNAPALDLPDPPSPPRYDPTGETFDEYVRRRERVERAYREEAERRTAGTGLVPTPVKKNPEHFTWLVRYQVHQWTYQTVADRYFGKGSPANTVKTAIKTLASQLPLTLRRGTPGRPTKPKKPTS